jgi:DNA-binding response OmpR family regulator
MLVAAGFAEVGRLVRDLLVHQGFDVNLVQTGQAALELTGTESYRLLILDVNLPGCGGIEIVQKLRAEGLSVPAVLMASSLSEGQGKQLSRLAGVAFLAKPFVPEDLARAIAQATGAGGP